MDFTTRWWWVSALAGGLWLASALGAQVVGAPPEAGDGLSDLERATIASPPGGRGGIREGAGAIGDGARDPDVLVGHGGPVRAIASLDAGAIVTGGFDSALIVWSLRPAAARRVLRHHDSTVNAIAALPGGCFASGGEDARIAIWCAGSDKPVRVLSGHTAPVAALAVSPDGRLLASGSWDHTVRLWPIEAQAISGTVGGARIIEGHKGPVNGLAFLGDGSALASAGYDGQLRLTPVSEGDGAALSVVSEAPMNAVTIAPAGDLVVAGADGRIRFYDRELRSTGVIEVGTGPLTTVAVSNDGAKLATAGMRTPVTLIDGATRKPVTDILGPGLPVWAVTFTADGRELVTGGADRAIRRWDAETGRPAGDDLSGAVEDTAGADAHPGARVFRACRACHSLSPGESNRAGPTLYGIMGRKIASAPGYAYSEALQKRDDIEWSPETVARLFEVGPNAYLPGTKMPEQTITNPDDRKALVEWLQAKTRPKAD